MTQEELQRVSNMIGNMEYNKIVGILDGAGIKDPSAAEFDEKDPLRSCHWSEEDRCYVAPNGRKFDSDGEELIPGYHQNDFDDIRFHRLRERYGYEKAREMMQKGGH